MGMTRLLASAARSAAAPRLTRQPASQMTRCAIRTMDAGTCVGTAYDQSDLAANTARRHGNEKSAATALQMSARDVQPYLPTGISLILELCISFFLLYMHRCCFFLCPCFHAAMLLIELDFVIFFAWPHCCHSSFLLTFVNKNAFCIKFNIVFNAIGKS